MPQLPIRLVAIALLVIGCSDWRPAEPSLNGWPLGDEVSCGPSVPNDVVHIASAQLGTSPSAIRCYREGAYLSGGREVLLKRSGGVVIVVFSFDDGTSQATGVYCNANFCSAAQPPRQDPRGG